MIPSIVAASVMVGAAVCAILFLWRRAARRRMDSAWRSLKALPGGPETFRPEMVSGLPDPARRHLLHAIAPGTPLHRSVELTMTGTIALRPGSQALPMEATQIIAWPRGYIWEARVGSAPLRFSGFDLYRDGEAAMRWWLWGLIPLVRQDGPEIARSAAGRLASEAVLIPTALLPELGAAWEPVSEEVARVSVRVGGERLDLTLTVSSEGRLRQLEFLRWHPGEKGKAPGRVPWRAEVLEERSFQGITIPGHLRALKYAGRPEEHEFVVQEFEQARFL